MESIVQRIYKWGVYKDKIRKIVAGRQRGNSTRDYYYQNIMNYRVLTVLRILFVLGLVAFVQSVNALTLEEQRKLYENAKKALQGGRVTAFLAMAEQLQDYPLYPYLRYNYLSPRLYKVKPGEIQAFIREYNDFPLIDTLRTRWLRHLAKTGQWETYLENYTPQKDPELQCFELQARMKTGNRIYLLEDIRSVWLSGKSLPQQCDPAFALLYKSNLMTNELVWDRIRLAMDRGNTGLTNYLSKRLDGYYRTLAAQWVAMHHNPDSLTRKATLDDTAPGREILVYGIKRLARININRAINNWETLQEQYQFSTREISDTNNHLAVRAARQNHPRSKELLDNIDNFLVNDDVFHWRLRTALEDLDWNMLRKWTTGVAPIEDIRLRWIYWQARALEQTGDFELARKAYASIAGKRDYYGFLAADRLGIPYNLNHKPLPDNPEAKQKVAAMPGMQRAKELRALDKNFQARREWHHALNLMTGYEKEIAATLAVDWGWHDRAIFAVSAAHSYDDLVLRFPIPFRDIIDTQVEKNSLDAGWVYALIRSESAFMEKVKSPAGAIGLMQVMPTTGKLTARKIGIKGFRTSDLEKAGKNVPIGSAYLREMLEKFNGNRVLATAAYNAGPNRVKRWLPKSGCMEPDIWIEKIPFNETWKYVRRVMFYASIYDWRLQESIKSLNQRMASIDAPPQLKLAALSCTGQQVSYN